MGRYDDMPDRAGYEAWFREHEGLTADRDCGAEPDAWKTPAGTLCTECMWDTMVTGNPVMPLDGRGETMCTRCGRSLNERGDLLLARAEAFVGAAEAAGLGHGDTGSDDGPYDATGYAAIWVEQPYRERALFQLAESHRFAIDEDDGQGYGDGGARLFYFLTAEEGDGKLPSSADEMLSEFGWKG